jgi:release factor glutamine methyltransferase
MNANSKQPVPITINDWLASSAHELAKANVPSARLDAELMLCHMLGVDRAWLIAHGDLSLARAALSHTKGVHPGGITVYGEKLLLKRLQRQPMAYLLGHKEFYGREFIVNKDVLIPRPETEVLIELAKKHDLTGHILDVGTGSGAIGLTLWHELKDVSLTLSDISEDALEVAKKNAKKLKVKSATFTQSDLLEYWLDKEHLTRFDVIVANLPYVDKSWERSPETNHEPRLALFAADGGLELIKQLIDQASDLIGPEGYLLLESDPEQQNDITGYAYDTFRQRDRLGYGLLLQKI